MPVICNMFTVTYLMYAMNVTLVNPLNWLCNKLINQSIPTEKVLTPFKQKQMENPFLPNEIWF